MTHAEWTSALVSARTIEVTAFTLAETRLLLTEPLKHSSLWKDNEAKRPRFDAAFWGTEEGSGIEFIHAQADGWPHLVQLIAETLVDLINEEQAAAVTPALLQRARSTAKPSCADTTCFMNCCTANPNCRASGNIWSSSSRPTCNRCRRTPPWCVRCDGEN
ncbi:MAG: hypothetical protein U0Y68_12825 [Blastocatellia bacterium]